MKTLRDALIIVVLGGVVIWFAAGFLEWLHQRSLDASLVVRDREIACLNDRVDCHVGSDSFSSIAAAQPYLDSPQHLAKVKERGQCDFPVEFVS